jgi:hypothetical protein
MSLDYLLRPHMQTGLQVGFSRQYAKRGGMVSIVAFLHRLYNVFGILT